MVQRNWLNRRPGSRSRKLTLELLESRRNFADVSFDGGPDGTGVEWNNPVNWSNDQLPTVNDVAVIDGPHSTKTIILRGKHSIAGLGTEATIKIVDNGELSIRSPGTVFAPISIDSGHLLLFGSAKILERILTTPESKISLVAEPSTTGFIVDMDKGLVNNGTLELLNSSNVPIFTGTVFGGFGGGIYNSPTGSILSKTRSQEVSNAIRGGLINQGRIEIDGALDVSVEFAFIGPPQSISNGLVRVREDSTLNYQANTSLLINSPSVTYHVEPGAKITSNVAIWSLGDGVGFEGIMEFRGGSDRDPLYFNVSSKDQGPNAPLVDSSAPFGVISIRGISTTRPGYLAIRNDPTQGDFDAAYVGRVEVPAGATLDLRGVSLYARTMKIEGTVIGGTIEKWNIPNPHHNYINPFDVDGKLGLNPLDVLVIVNYLNDRGAGTTMSRLSRSSFTLDTNNDDVIDSLDALKLINEINRDAFRGEGEETNMPQYMSMDMFNVVVLDWANNLEDVRRTRRR